MFNYEHEIEIQNIEKHTQMKSYLWNDYFHDSIFTCIEYDESLKTLNVQLSCEREWESTSILENKNNDKYLYDLKFKNCFSFELHRNNIDGDEIFINSRFKKSYRLLQLKKIYKEAYHLRVQLSGGYIDVIFEEFLISKKIGKLEVYEPIEWYFERIRCKLSAFDIEEVLVQAKVGDFPHKAEALEYLFLISNERVLELARKSLDDEDAHITAVYIIGELGGWSDISLLNTIGNNYTNNLLMIKHIDDAITKILRRNNHM